MPRIKKQSNNESVENDFNFDLSVPHVSRNEIQKILDGMRPKKLENYRRALVHKSVQKYVRYALNDGKQVCSYLVEAKKPASNERLEFLGDSVLSHIVAEYIFEKYPGKDEGFMTRLRTKIVRDTHCVKFANLIGLGPHILAGPIVKREEDGNYNAKLLEDAFEAFLGAIRLDLGFEFARGFVIKLLEKSVNFDKLLEDDNYKDILMRYTQNKGISLPVYKQIKQYGPPHNRTFVIEVYITIDGRERTMGEGKGGSKKEAEQAAALATLKLIEESDLKEIQERDQVI